MIQEVLGSRKTFWFVPTPGACGDGLKYTTMLLPAHIQQLQLEQARQRQQEVRI